MHTSLNPRGGSERVAITAMQALLRMGIEIDLTTFEKPDISKLESAYGEAATSVIKRIKTTNILRSLRNTQSNKHYDLTINTHGDMLPYFLPSFSKRNAITYCHFPLAKYLIDSKDPEYARFLSRTILSTMSPRRKNSSQKYFGQLATLRTYAKEIDCAYKFRIQQGRDIESIRNRFNCPKPTCGCRFLS